MDSIERRKSIRKFKPETVSKEIIDTIINAARLAPSAKNRQPWKYIAYISQEKENLLNVMERSLKKNVKRMICCPIRKMTCRMLFIP